MIKIGPFEGLCVVCRIRFDTIKITINLLNIHRKLSMFCLGDESGGDSERA